MPDIHTLNMVTHITAGALAILAGLLCWPAAKATPPTG
jgi:hypothetical protein